MTLCRALLLLALGAWGAGCSKAPAVARAPPAGTAPGSLDAAGQSRLAAVRTEVQRLGICTAQCLETLEELHGRAPLDPGIREQLRAAHARRKDWDALLALEADKPAGPRSRDEQVYVATLHIEAGRYQEAGELLAPLSAAHPEDGKIARLAGIAFFHCGDYERAAPRLETAMARLPPPEAQEAATLRALVHFHRGERDAAETVLRRVLQSDPDQHLAHQALGRVLAAVKDPRAAIHLDRASALRLETAERERRALWMSAHSQMASLAAQERRFDDCERLVAQMLLQADPQQKNGLYKFLGDVRRFAGRRAEAEDAFRLAEQLSHGQPGT